MYKPLEIEREVLEFWRKNQIYSKNKEGNKGKKTFYFLQGPPYSNGNVHIGTAWNNSMKDSVLRYKRMRGFNVWDRAGWDNHGLPTESQIQKKFKLQTKQEIEKFGIANFIKECLKFSKENVKTMSQELLNLGVWMDFENAYMTIDESWIESAWFLVKKAHEKKRLYEGEKTMAWDPVTETALAKHECVYKQVTDKSIFVKFKLRNDDKYLLVWSTTPWTFAFNLAIMVHPDLDYVEAEVEGENWIIAKDLAKKIIKDTLNKDYVIKNEFKGSKLKGLRYEHPWEKDITEFTKLKSKHPRIHTVVLSKEYVNLESGTGLVHCAPGCGPEDYEVGYQNNIPPFNNLDERGTFPDNMGEFSGWKARKDDNKFTDKLKDNGALIGTLNYKHDYPHGERSNEPVIFRTTKQWFFKTEDLKERMLELNKQVHWVPEKAKNAFNSWLENLRDNSITRQRYYGIPVPIWKCNSCKKYTVIESKKDLIEHSGEVPDNLHKPWIDLITIRCGCGETKKRVPDVLDVWVDAGVGSFACLHYPHEKKLFEKYFPADFILEGKDQIRGWFNLLMISSILALNKLPFRNVYMHGFVTDVEGEKMSKSLGNVISPKEVTDKHGADTFRIYMAQNNAGEDINFSWDEIKNKYKNLSVLWNIHNYLLDYCRNLKINPTRLPKKLDLEEEYILSNLNRTIKEVTELYEFYYIDKVPEKLEEFILTLSRGYIQDTREKVNENPQLVLPTIFHCLKELIIMLSTICPFISEKIYQNLKLPFDLDEESVSLEEWPKVDKGMLNEKLEKQFSILQNIIQAGLAAREKAKKGVRWPLQELIVVSKSEEVKKSLDKFKELLKTKLNVKEVKLSTDFKFEKVNLTVNKTKLGRDFKRDAPKILKKLNPSLLNNIYKNGKISLGDLTITRDHIFIEEVLPKNLMYSDFKLGKVILDTKTTEELEKEGFARELIRRIQDLRKANGLKKKDSINLSIHSKYSLDEFKSYIKEKVGASVFEFKDKGYKVKDEFKVKGKNFKISFVKT